MSINAQYLHISIVVGDRVREIDRFRDGGCLPCVRGVEQYRDVREPKLESRIGMVGIKSVFRRATLRITNGDVSLESSIKHHIYSQLVWCVFILVFTWKF